jgi:aminoglycoside 2'-N-acetyltransferase I
MHDLRVAHTADLDPATLAAARALMYEVFAGEMTEHDWEHALGGIHAIVYEDGELAGHASVIQRRLFHAGRALRTGYVEGVAVRESSRRRGYGDAMMDAIERVIRGAYDLGALGATDMAADFYTARGWERWRGPTGALTPEGVQRTPDDDDSVFVLRLATPLDTVGELTCDWRDGAVW